MNPLTIFPKHPSAPDTYYIGGGWSPACITAVDKRFTDAELAAELWSQQRAFEAASRRSFKYADRPDLVAAREVEWERLRITERFATLGHYDENPA